MTPIDARSLIALLVTLTPEVFGAMMRELLEQVDDFTDEDRTILALLWDEYRIVTPRDELLKAHLIAQGGQNERPIENAG